MQNSDSNNNTNSAGGSPIFTPENATQKSVFEPNTHDETNTPENSIFDVNAHDFNTTVVEASHNQPIIIQFWADWCEPCKQLAPNLEAVVASKKGAVRLARLDIGANKQLAQQMEVKSVPTVACVYQGQPIDGFNGNIPKADIEKFVNSIIERCPVQDTDTTDISSLLDLSENALNKGDYMTALPLFMEILEKSPHSPIATAGLAKCYIHMGELEASKNLLDASEYNDDSNIINAKKALDITLSNAQSKDGLNRLKSAYESDTNNMQNGLNYAKALFASPQQSDAIDVLLNLFVIDKDWNEQAIKKELLQYFEILGFENTIAINGRKRLSSLLFV